MFLDRFSRLCLGVFVAASVASAQEILFLDSGTAPFGGGGPQSFLQFAHPSNPTYSPQVPSLAAAVSPGLLNPPGLGYAPGFSSQNSAHDLAVDNTTGNVYATQGQQILCFNNPMFVAPSLPTGTVGFFSGPALVGAATLRGLAFDPASSANGSSGVLWAVAQNAATGATSLVGYTATAGVVAQFASTPLTILPAGITIVGLDWMDTNNFGGGGTSVALVAADSVGQTYIFQFVWNNTPGTITLANLALTIVPPPAAAGGVLGNAFGVALNRQDCGGIVVGFDGPAVGGPTLIEVVTQYTFTMPAAVRVTNGVVTARPTDFAFVSNPQQLSGGPVPAGQPAVTVGVSAPTSPQAFNLQLNLGPTASPAVYALVFGASVTGLAPSALGASTLWLPLTSVFQPAFFVSNNTSTFTTVSVPIPQLPIGALAYTQWGIGTPSGATYLSNAQQILIGCR